MTAEEAETGEDKPPSRSAGDARADEANMDRLDEVIGPVNEKSQTMVEVGGQHAPILP